MTATAPPFRILSLDGGGSKGVYTLGILMELEQRVGRPLSQCFELIYGTSTGSIIGAGLSLGMTAADILTFYQRDVVSIMKRYRQSSRGAGLAEALRSAFGSRTFTDCKTGLGVVATNYDDKRPLIFKTDVRLSYGLKATFVPGFGCTLADAVEASCSAYPFFPIKSLETSNQGKVRAIDGGFVANNPVMLAYADALVAMPVASANIRVLTLGTGNFPERFPKEAYLQGIRLLTARDLISTQFTSSANATAKLFEIYSKGSTVVRINDTFSDDDLASSLFEYDLDRLNRLLRKGRDSFALKENDAARIVE